MKILVTGGAGFIGSHLVDSLIEDKHEVIVIDNLSTGRRDNLNPKAVFHRLDISRDGGKIEKLFKRERFDYVFHLAAMARINECLDKPIESFSINTLATLFLVHMARVHGAAFVFSSSSSVYGEIDKRVPVVEETLHNPISLYGVHKSSAEKLVLMYHKFYNTKTAVLRYFNVYGTSRQNPEGAYPNVFAAFGRDFRKGEITIYGDGDQERDYIHVFDVVKANKRFLQTQQCWGQAFNIGTGEPHTVNEVADYFDFGVKRNYQPARVGDPRFSCADTHKADMKLGFRSEVPFNKGVQIFLQSLKEFTSFYKKG
jgi:UDP-glucose 4-epimerase